VTDLRGASFEWPAIVELAGTWAGALGIEVLDAGVAVCVRDLTRCDRRPSGIIGR
jgi:hypothetical protein